MKYNSYVTGTVNKNYPCQSEQHPGHEEQQKQQNPEANTRLQKKERYDLLFVVRDLFHTYLDTTKTKYIKLLNKKCTAHAFFLNTSSC